VVVLPKLIAEALNDGTIGKDEHIQDVKVPLRELMKKSPEQALMWLERISRESSVLEAWYYIAKSWYLLFEDPDLGEGPREASSYLDQNAEPEKYGSFTNACILVSLGDFHRARGQKETALNCYSQALDEHGSAFLYRFCAEGHVTQDQYQKAIDLLSQGLNDDSIDKSKQADLLADLADLRHHFTEEDGMAFREIIRAIELDSDYGTLNDLCMRFFQAAHKELVKGNEGLCRQILTGTMQLPGAEDICRIEDFSEHDIPQSERFQQLVEEVRASTS